MADNADTRDGRQQPDREQGESGAYGGDVPGALAERMGVVIVAASSGRVVGRMPVHGNTQPDGLLHGGASCVLAETLGSTGAALHAGPERLALGVEINATHHRAVASGIVIGVATPLHLGRVVATYEIVVREGTEELAEQQEQGRRVCTVRLTCLVRDR